jgi:hypothetical protein
MWNINQVQSFKQSVGWLNPMSMARPNPASARAENAAKEDITDIMQEAVIEPDDRDFAAYNERQPAMENRAAQKKPLPKK